MGDRVDAIFQAIYILLLFIIIISIIIIINSVSMH